MHHCSYRTEREREAGFASDLAAGLKQPRCVSVHVVSEFIEDLASHRRAQSSEL